MLDTIGGPSILHIAHVSIVVTINNLCAFCANSVNCVPLNYKNLLYIKYAVVDSAAFGKTLEKKKDFCSAVHTCTTVQCLSKLNNFLKANLFARIGLLAQ